jgi:hypothetical protein
MVMCCLFCFFLHIFFGTFEGIGLFAGAALSLLVFKRRLWPVTAGLAFSFGYSASNCQDEFVPTGKPSKQ